MELEGVHYDAFISYRHADLDRFVAVNLHKRLERFVLPASVKKKLVGKKTKIERIFRDVDELPLSDDLSEPINNALANSDYLIVVATPRYSESQWCLKEIDTFLEMHDREHVLIVLAEGEPCDSFPKALTLEEVETIDEEGQVTTRILEKEPLAADTRGSSNKEILRAMDTAVIKIAAAIFGLNYDDLRQRHREHRIRKMLTIAGLVGAGVLAFAVVSFAMLLRINSQNQTIISQTAQLQDKYAGTMATTADQLIQSGRKKDAVYALRSVLPDRGSDTVNVQALRTLTQIMGIYDVPNRMVPTATYDVDCGIDTFLVSQGGDYVLIKDALDRVHLFEGSGPELLTIESGENSSDRSYAFVGREAFLCVEKEGLCYRTCDGTVKKVLLEAVEGVFLFSLQNQDMALVVASDCVYGVNPAGEIVYQLNLNEELNTHFLDPILLEVDEDKALLVLTDYSYSYYVIFNPELGNVSFSLMDEASDNVKACLEGDYLYFSKDNYVEEVGNCVATVCCLNLQTHDTMWTQTLTGVSVREMNLTEDNIYIRDYDKVIVLNKKDGGALKYFSCVNIVADAFLDDEGQYGYLDLEGKVFLVYEEFVKDCTSGFHAFESDIPLRDALYQEESFYYLPEVGNYLIRYSYEEGNGEVIESVDMERGFSEGRSAADKEVLVDGYVPGLVYNSIYSEDEKYILINGTDATITIYLADSLELQAYLTEADFYVTDMHYLEDKGIYILNSYEYAYLLDVDFNVIAKTNWVVACLDDSIVVTDDEKFYRMPLFSYEEIIRSADDYLQDYRPSEAIMKKYNLSEAN